MYHFRSLSDRSLQRGTSKISLPPSPTRTAWQRAGKFGVSVALFRGALLRLFGPPCDESIAAEEAYDYILEASDAAGHTWILTAYQGAGGPAIGGNTRDPSIHAVAAALLELIETTPPADFAALIDDEDLDFTVSYGWKDGAGYWHETPGNHLT